ERVAEDLVAIGLPHLPRLPVHHDDAAVLAVGEVGRRVDGDAVVHEAPQLVDRQPGLPREGAGQRGPARAEEGFEAALDVLPDLAPLLGRDLLFVLVLPQAEGLAMAVQAVAGLAKLRAHAVADRLD